MSVRSLEFSKWRTIVTINSLYVWQSKFCICVSSHAVTLIGLAQSGLLLWVVSGLSLATNGSLDGTLAATSQGSRVEGSFKHLLPASLR